MVAGAAAARVGGRAGRVSRRGENRGRPADIRVECGCVRGIFDSIDLQAGRGRAITPEEEHMVKVRKVDASLMATVKRADRPRSPAQLARERRDLELKKALDGLKAPDDAYEIVVEGDEKPLTIRQAFAKQAKTAGIQVSFRKSEKGWYVGLLTPERRTGRGRKPAVGV
jgi:hypothetical protein